MTVRYLGGGALGHLPAEAPVTQPDGVEVLPAQDPGACPSPKLAWVVFLNPQGASLQTQLRLSTCVPPAQEGQGNPLAPLGTSQVCSGPNLKLWALHIHLQRMDLSCSLPTPHVSAHLRRPSPPSPQHPLSDPPLTPGHPQMPRPAPQLPISASPFHLHWVTCHSCQVPALSMRMSCRTW